METPEVNRRRAVFVLGRIDEILSWEKTKEQEKDVRFVELGEYLCEVRAKQYWRLEDLKSFDEFLEKRFADSRRKAYYLMAIHENLTRIPKHELQRVGWSKATELVKVAHNGQLGTDVVAEYLSAGEEAAELTHADPMTAIFIARPQLAFPKRGC